MRDYKRAPLEDERVLLDSGLPAGHDASAGRARCCVRQLAVAAALTLGVVYLNGLVTRATVRHELPFNDGQSFCVVGNGPDVVGGPELGSFINSHDVVVRFDSFALEPSGYTGNKTDVHVVTADSPQRPLPGTLGLVTHRSWLQELLEWAHPYAFPLHAWAANFGEHGRFGTAGPSNGLLVTKFFTDVYPNSRVSTVGMDELEPRKPPQPAPQAAPQSRGQTNSSLRRALVRDGFQLVRGVFSRDDAATMRAEMLRRREEVTSHPIKRLLHRVVNPTGIETVDFMHEHRAWYTATSWLSFTPHAIETVLRPMLAAHFGDEAQVEWFFHNDAGMNHLSRWHKDRLNNNHLGRFRDDFEAIDPWEEGPYDIYKCLIYLQDHAGPNGVGPALDVIPGSHLTPASTTGEDGTYNALDIAEDDPRIRPVAPMLGDVIVFDQRISHRGHPSSSEARRILKSLLPVKQDGSDARILVTVGFGLKGSRHLPGFKAGTIARQRTVFFVTEMLAVPLELALLVAALLLARRACASPCLRRAAGRIVPRGYHAGLH